MLTACTEELEELDYGLTTYQGELLGRAVNFNASIAEPFTTRATYRHNGSFNEGDQMTIYRQYSNDGGQTFDTSDASLTYRVYQYDTKYATGTDIALETDWKPKVGAIGCTDGVTKTQTAADSLTWENGQTVRFRAWSRSNLSGTLNSDNKSVYYPDYCVSGWVTVSGPTLEIPLSLKHQGCRIGFTQKSGNVLYKAEISTDWEDYKRLDNSTDKANDTATAESGKTDADAQAEAAAVAAVYNKMCMPAGVDINTSLLKTMTKVRYNDAARSLKNIHTETNTDSIISFGTKDSIYIRQYIQRPLFSTSVNDRLYMITIPYDMSTASTQGESLTLPACTRFRIYIFDVNDGDRDKTDDYEGTYHIFSLSDIKDKSGNAPLFPNGLDLLPGYSYLFTVGYQYDKLTITPADSFSWDKQDEENGNGVSAIETPADTLQKYAWWKNAIKAAIPTSTEQSYNPAFHIQTREQLQELIALVNGTCLIDKAKNDSLTQVLDPNITYTDQRPATKADYRWYPTKYVTNGKVQNEHKSDSVSQTAAETQGYIFYEHYHPANADQAAYSLVDYLRAPYSFFDENLNRHFTIYLDNDLDLSDWELETIGNAAANPFRGLFDGQGHTIKDIYMKDEYMFGTCFDVSIMNLNIETTHNFKLINTSEAKNATTGYGADFVGISIKAPSTGHPFANSVTGSSYMVGCFYQGKAGGAMIGEADNLYMYGNMVAASGLNASTGALLGAYSGSSAFLAPQTGKTPVWGRFMVNYYDITLSPNVTAVGGVTDNYEMPQQYIRGAETHILKAKNDNLLGDDVPYSLLTSDLMRRGYYGLAPWKAMNYAIYKYNSTTVGSVSPCNVHFVANSTGYDNKYPHLVTGAPNSDDDTTECKGKYEELNVLKQNN